MQKDEQLIFFSYASGDRERVEPIADALISSGLDTWIDVRRLKAGHNWDFEIRRALDKAAVIVVFISNKSVTKRGYVQREIRLALEKAEEKLLDDIYLIPVLLDDGVTVPDLVKDRQFIRYDDEAFQANLLDAIKHQLERMGHAIETAQNESEIRWQFYTHHDSRDGIPGFEADLRMPRLSSDRYPMVSQVGEIVKGDLLRELSDLRYQTLNPDPESFNFGQEKYSRTHTLDVQPQTPKVRGKMLSIVYWLHSYYAMAAHPNHVVRTYCFLVDPLCHIDNLELIFEDSDQAFVVIQGEVRSRLLAPRDDDDSEYRLDPDWVSRGTENWDDLRAFSFEESGIEFHFAPYQVMPYAYGPQVALVEYEKIWPQVSRVFVSALGLEFYQYRQSSEAVTASKES